MPTYNGAAFIQRTLDSLAGQTWPNLEILIGDDCSTDNTREIVTAFPADRQDTRVLDRPANLGWLRNTNDLMSRAAGEFMFFAFHDDVIEPTYVARLTGALLERQDAVLAFSDMTAAEVDGTTRDRVFDELSTITSATGRGLVMARRPTFWSVPNRGSSAPRPTGRSAASIPTPVVEFSADWTWLLHLALLGAFVRVPETLCHKFYTTGSFSKTWQHVAKQRADLLRAGLNEVGNSSIGLFPKLVVQGMLLLRYIRARGMAVAWRIIKGS